MSYIDTPPSWQKDAVPSLQGWRHPRTNELLVSVRGIKLSEAPKPVAPVTPVEVPPVPPKKQPKAQVEAPEVVPPVAPTTEAPVETPTE